MWPWRGILPNSAVDTMLALQRVMQKAMWLESIRRKSMRRKK